MIHKSIGELEGLMQEFSDLMIYFRHLKDYVSYTSKDVK